MKPCRAACAGTAVTGTACQRGFSLVELVVVLVVIGLLAVVAVPRFFGNDVFAERAWYDEVGLALRYARNVAIASGCPVRVSLAAGSYALAQQAASGGHCDSSDASWPLIVRLSDGQAASGTAPAGVVLAPPVNIVFDAAGRTNLGTDLAISINGRALTLRADSGFVSP